ncbi:MAG: hypothetical protein EBS56_12265 [Planctomycetia bacterium]|nr:hypothetical protein [Planctomycetia bacterium]
MFVMLKACESDVPLSTVPRLTVPEIEFAAAAFHAVTVTPEVVPALAFVARLTFVADAIDGLNVYVPLDTGMNAALPLLEMPGASVPLVLESAPALPERVRPAYDIVSGFVSAVVLLVTVAVIVEVPPTRIAVALAAAERL